MTSSPEPRAGLPANTTNPYRPATESRRRRRSSCFVMSARVPWEREVMTTSAPSLRNRPAAADPSPPAPPTSRMRRPSSGNFFDLHRHRLLRGDRGQCDVAKCDDVEKHGEHFAVPEVVLEESFGEDADDYRDGSVKYEARLRWEIAPPQAEHEIPEHFSDHPEQRKQSRNAPLHRVLQINVVEVAVPAFGQMFLVDIRGNIALKQRACRLAGRRFHLLGSDAE